MDVITPLNNLPNLKQGQNGEEVALEMYGIVLDVKAHLPAPKETAVREFGLSPRCGRRVAGAHHALSHALLLVHERLVPPRAAHDDGGPLR